MDDGRRLSITAADGLHAESAQVCGREEEEEEREKKAKPIFF
jgi:hypothetical protein